MDREHEVRLQAPEVPWVRSAPVPANHRINLTAEKRRFSLRSSLRASGANYGRRGAPRRSRWKR